MLYASLNKIINIMKTLNLVFSLVKIIDPSLGDFCRICEVLIISYSAWLQLEFIVTRFNRNFWS